MSGRSVTVGSDERTQRRRIPLIAERFAQLPVRADAGVDGMRVLGALIFECAPWRAKEVGAWTRPIGPDRFTGSLRVPWCVLANKLPHLSSNR